MDLIKKKKRIDHLQTAIRVESCVAIEMKTVQRGRSSMLLQKTKSRKCVKKREDDVEHAKAGEAKGEEICKGVKKRWQREYD